MRSKGLGEQETASLRVLSFLNEGGKFLDTKTFPSFDFYILSAGVARPGELSLPRRANLLPFFFFLRGTLTMSPPFSWVSVSPNLNLLKLELGVDYLF